MAAVVRGPRVWRGSRGADGHREYRIVHRVVCDATEGPAAVLGAPGLPLPGSLWLFDSDSDPFAWCLFTADMKPASDIPEGEPITAWDVEQVFSTKPPPVDGGNGGGGGGRCSDFSVEDPLLEPPRITVRGNKGQLAAIFDRFGNVIKTSSHELIRGPENEWEYTTPVVVVEQNVVNSYYAVTLPSLLADCVNDGKMWGLPGRTIKLSNYDADLLYYGQCYAYYKRRLEFEIQWEGWDRDLLDEGTKVLNGHWDEATGDWVLDDIDGATPDPDNPSHFIKATDRQGNPINLILNGEGQPANVGAASGNILLITLAGGSVTVTTDAAHGLTTGDEILITGRGIENGDQRVRGRHTVTVVSSTDLLLQGLDIVGTVNYTTGLKWYSAGTGAPGSIHASRYHSANLFLLGLPTVF